MKVEPSGPRQIRRFFLVSGGVIVALLFITGHVFWAIVLLSVVGMLLTADRRPGERRVPVIETPVRLVAQDCRRPIGVVGEYFQRSDALAAARAVGGAVGTAILEAERSNPYDPDAVRVVVHGKHVGYLSRAHAKAYHPAVDLAEAHGECVGVNVTCRTWESHGSDPGERAEFNVYLPSPKTVLAELEGAYADLDTGEPAA